jgi:hypothetical protein
MLISLWLNFSGFRPLNLTSFVWLRMNGSQLIASLEYSDFLIVGVFVLILVFLFNRKIRESESWRATVTPLASIIGSGFLIIAPLLYSHFGYFSAVAMLVLVLVGYAVGSVIRGNILAASNISSNDWKVHSSRVVLLVAYFVSVAFYIKLLAAFAIHGFELPPERAKIFEQWLSTFILIFIGAQGFFRGFSRLERFEEYAVNCKLAIIGGLIVGLVIYNVKMLHLGLWSAGTGWNPAWKGAQVLMGSLVVVQGFETSQFMLSQYSPEKCAASMRKAQLISGAIYLIFISLMMVVSQGVLVSSDTAVIDMSAKVSSVLPILLVVAAVLSQFSAATADTIGAGGLVTSLHQKFSLKWAYVFIILGAVGLVWLTDVFQIVAIASRCFALYYAIECARSAYRKFKLAKTLSSFQIMLTFLLLLCVVFGIPAES